MSIMLYVQNYSKILSLAYFLALHTVLNNLICRMFIIMYEDIFKLKYYILSSKN